jgi:hypothetical protein
MTNDRRFSREAMVRRWRPWLLRAGEGNSPKGGALRGPRLLPTTPVHTYGHSYCRRRCEKAWARPPDGELGEVLVHPGLIGARPAPAPAAPHVDHIRHALNALVEHRRGKVSIEGCRPAETWAWMFTVHDAVALSPESTTDPTDYSCDWTVSIHNADVSAEADKLTRLLHMGI